MLALTKTEMILFAIADKDIAKDVFAKLTCSESKAVISNAITDDINDNLIDHDIRNTMENLIFGVIRVSYDVDTATIIISASDGTQEEFEQSLRELLEWLSANSITEIIFQSGGGCVFILPTWFKQACAQANIEIRYILTLWNQVFVGFRVPTGHVFSDVITWYNEFRTNYGGNTSLPDFRDWQLNTNRVNRLGAANANLYPLRNTQLSIKNLTDAEVQMLANQPTSDEVRNFLNQWSHCNLNVLPTCLADVYIAGHVAGLGLNNQDAQAQIFAYGLAGGLKSAYTLLNTGRHIGRHFGFLTQDNQPTEFFHQYFN